MPAHKTPRWTRDESAILTEVYPTGGLKAAQASLPHRSWASIYCRANKLGLKADQSLTNGGRRCSLQGPDLDEATRLRDQEGWSFARIGAHLGYAECTVSNAVIIAKSKAGGFSPADRDKNGRITPAGMERLRWMLKKGLKGVEIQLRLGVSAACVAEQRRRYNADLAARGKAPLPPPGNGECYSGARVTIERKRAAEALFLEGYGTAKVSERSGVSKTVCTRVRRKLIARLKRKGERLPGCDANGKRRVMIDHANHIPAPLKDKFRALLLDRMPVRRAAAMCAIGSCSAYRLRDEIRAEIGAGLPAPKRIGRLGQMAREVLDGQMIPAASAQRYRDLVRQCGQPERARLMLLQELANERRALASRPRTFEEQLERVANGAPIANRVDIARPTYDFTLGGVSGGML